MAVETGNDVLAIDAPEEETTPLLSSAAVGRGATRKPCDEENGVSSATAASAADERRKSFATHVSPTTVVLVLAVGSFVAQLDTSFVLATHSKIASEFGELSNSSWIIASYTLAMCACQPAFGKVSDVFGRKTTLMAAYLLFAAGSVVCGAAGSLPGVVVGRVIAGVGGAGIGPLVSLIILDLVPLREVAKLRGYLNIATTLGRSLGGPIGGTMTDTIGWRASFVVQSPLLLLAGAVAFPLIPGQLTSKSTFVSRLRRIDFLGSSLLAASVTTFMLVLELTGRKVSWNDTLIISLITASATTGLLFLFTEIFWAVEPIFPLHLLRNKDVVITYLLFGLQISAQFSLMYCIPLYFEVTENAPSSVAGAHLFPAVAGNTLGALLSGWIIHRYGQYKMLAVFATISAALCYTLLIFRWRGNINIWESLEIFPGGFGTGMVESAAFISLSSAVDKSMQAVALSGLFQAANVGAITGLAISSSVLQRTLQDQLQSRLDQYSEKKEIIEKAISDISYVMTLTGRLHDIVVVCYLKALEHTHAVSLACSLFALLAALAIKQRSL
ncbi:uncharacterized protein PV09_08718 [Verruconis gallopava]|uniref:Major facilitator superfamily (MFS) profile domain-containing protein n=1 Tax=Verruconis gallopava TaxID=253628 RepID=A0A0D2AKV5_9PEZI|nr:uncharacterized protein PV09_08718 [Verruconis gallopava]KIV99663.1 hypothetical protein PV09_08718 [Verruconis gallopava]